jgi:hypothetical protein
MNETPTAGQMSAARRDCTGTGADLEAILEEWDVHIVDEVDDNPERNPHVGFVPAEGTSLVDALEAWRDAAVREALAAQLVTPNSSAYPGIPGMTWSDRDGDRWILCEDGRFRLRPDGPGVDPNEIAHVYGPMTLAGGA